MKLSVALLLGALGSALPAHMSEAQTRRPMAVEDLLTAIRVGDPQVSPDGRRVLFTRTTTDLSTGKRNADIWMVPTDGSGESRALIQSPKGDDTPRFLRDGRDSVRLDEQVSRADDALKRLVATGRSN